MRKMLKSLVLNLLLTNLVRSADYPEFQICLLNSNLSPSQMVLESTNPEYSVLNYQWNIRDIIYPKGFVKVNTANEVSSVIKCASSSGVQVVARSGGHSYNKYSLNSNTTVVVDLNGMKEFNMDNGNGQVTLGPGNLLGEVYYKLWQAGQYGLPAGSCPTVGISGHTLGGGYGLSSRKYGLMIDNLIEVEIVDSKGNLVTANERCNSDLFWALRGGGSGNFGIVTKFKFKAFKVQANVLRLTLHYPINRFMDVFDAFQKLSNSNPDSAITSTAYIHKVDGFSISTVIQSYSEDNNSKLAQDIIARFPADFRKENYLESMTFIDMVKTYANLAKIKTVEDLNTVSLQDNPKQYFYAKSFYVNKLLNTQQLEALELTLQQAPEGGFLLVDMQNGKISEVSANATAFPNRNNLFTFQAVTQIDTDIKGKLASQWVDLFETIVKDKDIVTNMSYFNYLSSDIKDGLTKYYGSNLERLIEVKKKWDLDNFFKYDLSIPI